MTVVSVWLPDDLLKRLDAQRGQNSRSNWIREAVELGLRPAPVVAPVKAPGQNEAPEWAKAVGELIGRWLKS